MLLRLLVARGAAWLDRYDPVWHQRINVRTLSDTDGDCVLGQAFGDAGDFLDNRYFLDRYQGTVGEIASIPLYVAAGWFFWTHGFTPFRDPEVVWRRLWEAEVLKRQVGTSAPVEDELAEAMKDLSKVRG